MDLLPEQAIQAALQGNWKLAEKLNKEILAKEPKNIEALNRLAKAYAELGKLPKAVKLSQKALKIDPLNSIAQKCVARWKNLKKTDHPNSPNATIPTFIEEAGKTKIVNLINLGDEKILMQLSTGEQVVLSPHLHRVSVLTKIQEDYIGRFPDDLSAKLIKLMKLGHTYESFVMSAGSQEVKIFIKEMSRGEKYPNVISFPVEVYNLAKDEYFKIS